MQRRRHGVSIIGLGLWKTKILATTVGCHIITIPTSTPSSFWTVERLFILEAENTKCLLFPTSLETRE